MNRYMNQFQYTIEKDSCTLYGSMVVGATGAVGTVTGAGISGITRTDTGDYTITLQGPFSKLLAFYWIFGGGVESGIGSVELQESLANQTVSIRASTVKITTFSSGTTEADPAEGSVLQFQIVGRISSVDVT